VPGNDVHRYIGGHRFTRFRSKANASAFEGAKGQPLSSYDGCALRSTATSHAGNRPLCFRLPVTIFTHRLVGDRIRWCYTRLWQDPTERWGKDCRMF